MADDKSNMESLKQKRSNAQRNFTTRINRLSVSAGRLREVDLSQELLRLRDDYDKLLDVCNEYIDALARMDPTGDDSESQDALAKRDTSEQKFCEGETMVMEILWSKYAAPDIDALVTKFKSTLGRAEALWKDKVVPWTQQGVESGKLDSKLHELRDAVYTWRDYRPHGKDKWTLYLSLREDKEQLMDEWTCRRDAEDMKRRSTDRNDDSNGEGSEEDKDVGGDNAVDGHATTESNSLRAGDNVTVTQPASLAIATQSDDTQPAVVTSPIDGQRTVYVTSPPPFIPTDRANIITSAPQVVSIGNQPPGRYAASATFSTPQETFQPNLQSRQPDGGLSVGVALPPTLSSTPQLLGTHAAPPIDPSMGQGSSGPYSGTLAIRERGLK